MKELRSTHLLTVRFNEVDSLGIVWHGHYIAYMEEAREAFAKKHGISYLDIKKEGFDVPIVKTSTEHLLPLKYGDSMMVETIFKNTFAAKMIFEYVIRNTSDEVVCKGETVQVFVANETREMSLATPEFFKQWKLESGLLDG
ncbi:MAG TPA: thioesterase family protein [Aquaticitalea sp.]|nr:thioesterase family protein [Aquaticitalea sp.]